MTKVELDWRGQLKGWQVLQNLRLHSKEENLQLQPPKRQLHHGAPCPHRLRGRI